MVVFSMCSGSIWTCPVLVWVLLLGNGSWVLGSLQSPHSPGDQPQILLGGKVDQLIPQRHHDNVRIANALIGCDMHGFPTSSSSLIPSLSHSHVNLEWCEDIKLPNLLLPRKCDAIKSLQLLLTRRSGRETRSSSRWHPVQEYPAHKKHPPRRTLQ